jgi:hypothetical protein
MIDRYFEIPIRFVSRGLQVHPETQKVKVKLKVTLVQALRLCTGRMAHRVSRGIALPFHDYGTRSG